ncbi:deoxyguanosinetriphosphate triphosphohydrolase [Nocardioides marmoribigeumensis]
MEPDRREGAYAAAARARWGEEPAKVSLRTAFARDRGRVVHSAALRRLAAKTQVLGPQTDDFVRNRLTHTLEVAQVARDLASQLGCDTDVAETAALAHDLGHPPFGHNGEKALADLADGIGGFEGNAQTLRILTRLEAKFLDPDGRSIGLNLTRATLDAATKYPWPRRAGEPKFGVYADDLPVFTWLREGAPEGARCLEAQVMDLSDDIAYSVHDVEDGIVAGSVELVDLADPGLRRTVWDTAREWYHPGRPDDAFEAAWSRLTAVPGWPDSSYDGSRRALGALKNLTSVLIGRFCAATTDATLASYGPGPLLRYDADLVVPDETLLEIGVLKSIAAHLVMEAAGRRGVLSAQRELLAELVSAVDRAGPSVMEPMFRADLADAADDDARLRVVIDQVASLTDASAVSWHRRLC